MTLPSREALTSIIIATHSRPALSPPSRIDAIIPSIKATASASAARCLSVKLTVDDPDKSAHPLSIDRPTSPSAPIGTPSDEVGVGMGVGLQQATGRGASQD